MGMASGIESELEDAPAVLYRSAVWNHFAFRVTYDDGGMKVVDKIATVCNIVQHVLFMLTVTRLTCQLICEDIIPVKPLTAQGGKGVSRQDNFCSPQPLNSLSVTSQTGQHA